MENTLRQQLIDIAKQKISRDDPSHDIGHALRVFANAEAIGEGENSDWDILTPAALFHDVIQYPRNDPRSKLHAQESADKTRTILSDVPNYPKEKIEAVHYAVRMHNSKNTPDTVEARILQDADSLEITGAIIVMRMFASAGQMGRSFYHPDDPWGEKRELDGMKWTLDYYLERLLRVEGEMHTSKGRSIAVRRTEFLKHFMEELRIELKGV